MDDGKLNESSQITERDYQRVVNAWAMYDWANSAFAVVILTAIFPVYYRALVINAVSSFFSMRQKRRNK